MLKDKTLLITGGTGSFGNAALRKFINTDIGEIRIFSRDETKQDDMRNGWAIRGRPNVKFFVGDVRNYDSIDSAMTGVDLVFHAAALKQVPSCEFFPIEAMRTNVQGTENVLAAASKNGVKSVICLSTDKAVYPINAMGLTKALMEKVACAKARLKPEAKTTICVTRYGNVMCSRGSVIPLFVKQIKNKQPITITDPDMTRFMMSLDEAIDLVLFAFEHGKSGEIFVQKAPAATIGDLAEALKEIFDPTAEIRQIGTRHGEKLFESLLTREEMAKAVDLGRYYKIPLDSRDLNYGNYFAQGEIAATPPEEYNSHNTLRLNKAELIKLLLSLDYVQAALNSASAPEGY